MSSVRMTTWSSPAIMRISPYPYPCPPVVIARAGTEAGRASLSPTHIDIFGDILSRSPIRRYPPDSNEAAGFANNFSEQGKQPVLNWRRRGRDHPMTDNLMQALFIGQTYI